MGFLLVYNLIIKYRYSCVDHSAVAAPQRRLDPRLPIAVVEHSCDEQGLERNYNVNCTHLFYKNVDLGGGRQKRMAPSNCCFGNLDAKFQPNFVLIEK